MHTLWGHASAGDPYEKRLWAQFAEGLYFQAARAGHVRPGFQK
jgi:hypothetical protein